MAVNGIEIKVGQTWRTRGSALVTITGRTGNPAYPFLSSSGAALTEAGSYWTQDEPEPEDLVALVTDTPTEKPIPTPEVTETPLERRAQQSALAVQVGGNHYKTLAIQPVEYCHRNGLGFCESSVVKYVTRWRAKNGVKDLEKAKHFIDLLIEMEGGAQ